MIMSSFTTPLELEYIDGESWKVTREFDYLVDYEDKEGDVIRVPEGFITDFASVPRFLWVMFPPTGKYGKAAVVHDYLYVVGGKVPCRWCGDNKVIPCPKPAIYTKKDADQIFLDAMKALGVNLVQRRMMYTAVRWFGRGNFGKV